MMKNFILPEGTTTREVNAAVRWATERALDIFEGRIPSDVTGNEELRRKGNERRYVFGIGNQLRDTLVAHHIVGSGEIGLVFPNNYKGFHQSSSYDQVRVFIYDLIIQKLQLRRI